MTDKELKIKLWENVCARMELEKEYRELLKQHYNMEEVLKELFGEREDGLYTLGRNDQTILHRHLKVCDPNGKLDDILKQLDVPHYRDKEKKDKGWYLLHIKLLEDKPISDMLNEL